MMDEICMSDGGVVGEKGKGKGGGFRGLELFCVIRHERQQWRRNM